MGHRDNRAGGVRPPVDAREGVMLTVGSLFSGIGGLDLGLERAGMSVAWQVENDPFCAAVLEKHWPGVKRYGDIREIRWEEVESVDLVCGGFPCQPVSLAGRRLGTTDDRWLWPEFARCVRTVRPRYVLVENVPGLLVRGMGDVLGDLAACGYDAEWDCLPAAAVGAPHLRYRVFIVAYTAGTQRDAGTEISGELLGDDADGQEPDYADRSGADVADTTGERFSIGRRSSMDGPGRTVSESDGCGRIFAGLQDDPGIATASRWWAVEPDVGRIPDGFPGWLDRHIGRGMSDAESRRAVQTLRGLWNRDLASALWRAAGGLDRLSQAAVLFALVLQHDEDPDQARLLLASPQALEECLR